MENVAPHLRHLVTAPRSTAHRLNSLVGAETRLALFTPPGQEDRVGTFSNVVVSCEDIQSTHEELRGRDVEFTWAPSEQPWGLWAEVKDLNGSKFDLIQRQ